jgi:hypothetical protein
MGSISFLLPDPLSPIAQATLPMACFAPAMGASGTCDQVPVPTHVEIAQGRLTVSRSLSESGFLLVPWPVGQFGTLIASTTTLRETDEPYRLLVELARGKLNQVRTQAADWKGIGLHLAPTFEDHLLETTRLFRRALLAPPSAEADHLATRVLEQCFTLSDMLVREFIVQMFETRHHEEGPLESRLAARLIGPPVELAADYSRAFNAVQIGICWREVEPEEARYDWTAMDAAVNFARSADLPITAGPVIDLSPSMLPKWAAGWERDFPTLAAFMCDFVETVIGRYKKDITRWVICAGFNQANSLGLDDDDRLRLAFRLFEAANQVDPNLELVLSIAQPWGDYLVDENHIISPLTFPDDLIRAGVRLSGLEVELRAGTMPRGSWPRDLLETARVINLFGILQLPLEIVLSYPSSAQPDASANANGQSIWTPMAGNGLTVEGQAEWGSSFASLALCIPHVRAVTWDNWSDGESHLTPSGGLVDSSGRPKPLLSRLRTLRSAHVR